MERSIILGIDAGGTHTDAALIELPMPSGTHSEARLLASAKTPTLHEDLPRTVRAVLTALKRELEHSGPNGPQPKHHLSPF